MDYRDRHVVVTGGTGTLGTAVVGALIETGAVCHVPYVNLAVADRFAWRNHSKVKLVPDIELTQEAAVARLYVDVPQLWASIQIAGGFAMASVTNTTIRSDAADRHEFRARVPLLPSLRQRHDSHRGGRAS